MSRHRPAVLAHEDPAGIRRDAQHIRVCHAIQLRVGCGPDIDFWSGAPESSKDTPVRSTSAWNLTRMTRPLQLRN